MHANAATKLVLLLFVFSLVCATYAAVFVNKGGKCSYFYFYLILLSQGGMEITN